jgi:hypothetical protein
MALPFALAIFRERSIVHHSRVARSLNSEHSLLLGTSPSVLCWSCMPRTLSWGGLYDAGRTAFLESKGFRVLRFRNSDVKNSINEVMAAILDEVGEETS